MFYKSYITFIVFLFCIVWVLLQESCIYESLPQSEELNFHPLDLAYVANKSSEEILSDKQKNQRAQYTDTFLIKTLRKLSDDKPSSVDYEVLFGKHTVKYQLIQCYYYLKKGFNAEAFKLVNQIDSSEAEEYKILYTDLWNEAYHQMSIRDAYKLDILQKDPTQINSDIERFMYLKAIYYNGARLRSISNMEKAFAEFYFGLYLSTKWEMLNLHPGVVAKLIDYLGIVYLEERKDSLALECFKIGLYITDTLSGYSTLADNISLHIAYSLDELDQEACLQFIEKLATPRLHENEYLKKYIFFTIGILMSGTDKLQIALDYLYQSIDKDEELNCDDLDNRTNDYLAYIYRLLGDFDKALDYSNKAMNFLPCDSLRSLDIESWSYYRTLGNTYFAQGVNEKNKALLQEALKIFTNQLKQRIGADQEDIAHYADLLFTSSGNTLKTLFELNNLQYDYKYLNQAFQTLSEAKNRSIKIADRKHRSEYYLNLSKKDQDRLSDLNHIIASCLDSCHHFDTIMPFESEFYKDLYFAYKEKDALLAKYPQEQISLDTEKDQLDLNTFQKQLYETNTQYLDFFFGYDYGLVLSVTQDTCVLDTFDMTLVDSFARQFYYDLTNSDTIDFTSNLNLSRQILLPYIDTSVDQLIVCPDNILNGIPFDALTLHGESGQLIHNMAVSYVTGPGDLIKDRMDITDPSFALISYSDNETRGRSLDTTYMELFHSDYECQAIKDKAVGYEVNYVSGRTVKEKTFREALKSNIFHFAGHSQSGQASIHDNHFVIRDKEGYPKELPGYAIKQWSSNVDLAVLSSCESGIGRYTFGEGTYSLSRQFLLTGTKTVVKSLWKVEDTSTKYLMTSFYANLFDGYPASESLRMAKLDLINNATNTKFKDPYYWSGFVLEGQPSLSIK